MRASDRMYVKPPHKGFDEPVVGPFACPPIRLLVYSVALLSVVLCVSFVAAKLISRDKMALNEIGTEREINAYKEKTVQWMHYKLKLYEIDAFNS